MSTNQTNRLTRELSDEEKQRIEHHRKLVAEELPELVQRDQLRKEAQDEPTLSGEVRRAIHRCDQPLSSIAKNSSLTTQQLDEFLTGERTLRSDALDRLAAALGFHFESIS